MAVRRHVWDFGDKIPLKGAIEPAVKSERIWLHWLRIIYVLSGTLNIRVGTRTHLLDADGIIVINPYEVFSIQESGSVIFTFDLDLNSLNASIANPSELWFDCNSLTAAAEEPLQMLKTLLARFIKLNSGGDRDMTLANTAIAYEILHHLVSFFPAKRDVDLSGQKNHLHRIEGIARYIDENYKDGLMLKDLAAHFYLSIPYMSKLFRQYFGCTFTDYLAGVQLANAEYALLGSQIPVDEIARQCGFASTRSLNTCFKQAHGMSPSQYRKQHIRQQASGPEAVSGAPDFVRYNDLSLLAGYLNSNDPDLIHQDERVPQLLTNVPVCDVSGSHTALRHTFKKLISIGRASHILYAENQSILRQVRNDVGFQYVIFHGLLDDDMMVYGEDSHGNVDLNFCYVNIIFDFLRSIGLRPFIELSFMPRQLAMEDSRRRYYNEAIISLPKSMDKWNAMIRGLVLNLNNRYGAEEVALWPFSLWNLPDSSEGMFGLGGVQAYYDIYRQTWQTVKACNPGIRFGGPSCLTDTAEDGGFMAAFTTLCRSGGCLPDYYQYHFYPLKLEPKVLGDLMLVEQHLVFRPEADAMQRSISKVRKKTGVPGAAADPLYITEWNFSISHRELLTDTVFQAAYITKNILENYDSVDGLCYWAVSDSIDEVRMANELFHGGLGLFTYNGIRKASYYAYTLLARLGNSKLASGDGYFITRSNAGLQIILYNYHHFSDLYANGELFDMTLTNRYTPFPNPVRRKFQIPLTGLSSGAVILTETILNRQHGSSFDKWVEQGALPLDTPYDIEYLKNMSVPQIKKRKLTAYNGELSVICTLEPHEVRLVEIRTG